MFNKDFYPTPKEVLEQMGIDCQNKVVLEPSAGSGNMIDFLREMGAKDILACELNAKLAEIVKSKAKFLKNDFLKVTSDEISHVNLIVMNPPFSKGAEHLLHAWEVAPAGCEILSLLNYETINNDYSRERKRLTRLIRDYGIETNLGNVFSESERSTEVEIALIKLFKPNVESNEFDGFFMDEEVEEQGTGIMQYNVVRDVVQRYINSVKKFEEIMLLAKEMESLNGLFSVGTIKCEMGYNDSVTDKETYKKELQKKAWGYLFNKMNMKKYVTSGVMKDINSFVENQNKVPFTMKNIYKMFEIIVGTRQQTFDKSLAEAVDRFTEYTHENRYNVEGWKTNAGHLLNKKFIVPYMFEMGYKANTITIKYSSNQDKISDLTKVLCNIQAQNFDEMPDLYNYVHEKKVEPNKWYDWGFFEIKGFKKGTMHLKFKDDNVWANINRAYAKVKGQVLPEKI
jgi:hypothetical protein